MPRFFDELTRKRSLRELKMLHKKLQNADAYHDHGHHDKSSPEFIISAATRNKLLDVLVQAIFIESGPDEAPPSKQDSDWLKSPLSMAQINAGWAPIISHPVDGSSFQVLCKHGTVIERVFWGHTPMGRGMLLRGTNNILSPYLELIAWRPIPDKSQQKEVDHDT